MTMEDRAKKTLRLDHQLLHLPSHRLNDAIHTLHRDAQAFVSSFLSSVASENASRRHPLASDPEAAGRVDANSFLHSLFSKIDRFKLTMENLNAAVALEVKKCQARFFHLHAGLRLDDPREWRNVFVNRLIVDYLLRSAYLNAATDLSILCDLEDLVDIEIIRGTKEITDALQNKEATAALDWCANNKSHLENSKSNFEFLLRYQELIELVRNRKIQEAMNYKQTHFLEPWMGDDHKDELDLLESAMALRSKDRDPEMEELFMPEKWGNLSLQFLKEFCILQGISTDPLLTIYLQTGLSGLKTRECYENKCPEKDPLFLESFKKLAEPLPYAKRIRSQIVCHITGEAICSENPAYALPNGNVYGFKALKEMQEKTGKIECPKSGLICGFEDLAICHMNT